MRFSELLKWLGGVVPLSIFRVSCGIVTSQFNLPISPVPSGVRRVISQNIVTLGIFADRFKNLAQVVGIKNGLTARVQCQSSQSLLRVGDGRILIANGLATV